MAQSQTIKAASVQIAPVLNDREATTEKVCSYIQKAAAEGAGIVVFPETFIPNYPYFAFVTPPVRMGKQHMKMYQQAVEVPGPVTHKIGKVASENEIVVVVGVNERDHGTIYNAQLIFESDGEISLKRRKITPTFHERMVWGQGDGSGLRVVDTSVGRIGALACWEHYNPLARYALMTEHEQIHCSQFPGSMVGPVFSDQIEVTIRHHALESGCFVINSTGWLHEEQISSITDDPKLQKGLQSGCMTTIISPEGKHLAEPITEGEGIAFAELDMSLIDKRKRMMDSVGHYARPELLSLAIDRSKQETSYASFKEGYSAMKNDNPTKEMASYENAKIK